MRKSTGVFFTKTTPTRKLARKSGSRQDLRSPTEKVTLQRVLGLTTTNTNGLSCNPITGFVAYPAGCVIVLYDLKTNQQTHVFSPDKKTITCVDFSKDGRYLASGESGQQPSVRVWELGETISQVAELRGHKSGITSVEFSPNQKLLVSIGDQHDMLVNLWNWKLGHTVACNKSGCRVRAVSFSEAGNYLVTVGNRHVKFWYLDTEATAKANVPITPITGRSGILGDQRNNCFTDVQCGHGKNSGFTYCVTKSGLLCLFSEKRILDKWVELKAGSTNCLVVTSKYIFCGCSDGVIHVFEPTNLKFIATLPKPHQLGVNVTDATSPSDLLGPAPNKHCPDLVAIAIDEEKFKLTSIYNDHSMYIWDVHDVKKVAKTASFLYHSACIWGVETYPYLESEVSSCLPHGCFLTCSSDDTIRMWNLEKGGVNKVYQRNLYSKELLKIIYIDEGLTHLQDISMAPFVKDSDSKNGVRCMQISPDGQVIATGDRSGNLRIYDLQFFDEVLRVEAHESEILCVEFSSPESGYNLLASSSRDRLIHIFDVSKEYELLQTIDDHSSSITAVKFNFDLNILQLLSCGADKVVMFHTAQVNDSGHICFMRNTIVPGKATLYDMDIEPTRKFAATVGQDRNVRLYDIQGAKQMQCYKGSQSEEGNLIKIQLDRGGVYAAISCSDKTIGIYDFESGECESSIFGHSELVTGLKFTGDGKHLISVSGDGCIFVWNLPSTFVENVRNRIRDLNLPIPEHLQEDSNSKLRRQTFIVSSSSSLSLQNEGFLNSTQLIDTPLEQKISVGYRFSVGQLPLWAQKQIGAGDTGNSNKGLAQPLGRWGEREAGLTTVHEFENKLNRKHSGSQDSLGSILSDKSLGGDENNIFQTDVIYPLPTDESSNNDPDRTFHVKETSQNGRKKSLENGDTVLVDDAVIDDSDSISQISDNSGSHSEQESDNDEAFSPLNEHFEKLGTPAASGILSRPRNGSSSSDSSDVNQPFIPGHRASISAKFLSRSQKSSRNSSSSSSSAEDQRKRLEALKAKINYSNTTNTNKPNINNSNVQSRRSSIDTSLSPKLKAKDTIASSLKKNKLISKSCQNLSMAQLHQEFDDMHNNNYMKNQGSSLITMQDLISGDNRRISSTPKPQNKKIPSSWNAWNHDSVVSPVLSLLAMHSDKMNGPLSPKSSSQQKVNGNNASLLSKNKIEADPPTLKKTNVVMRHGGNRSHTRPKSCAFEAPTCKELQSKLLNEKFSQCHSDTDTEDDNKNNLFTKELPIKIASPVKSPLRIATSSMQAITLPAWTVSSSMQVVSSPQTVTIPLRPVNWHVQTVTSPIYTAPLPVYNATSPVRAIVREIDIDDQIADNNKDKLNLNENERVRQAAAEINANVRSLTMQALSNHDNNFYQDKHGFDEAKKLTLMYESGLLGSNKNLVQGSPPERDVPQFNDYVNQQSEATKVSKDYTVDTNVNWDECHSVMRNLVQSYSEARQMQAKVLSQPPSELQKQLLALISKTYVAIENNMCEQQQNIEQFTDLKDHQRALLESELFQNLQKSLVVTTDYTSSEKSIDVINVLDKYSNILVDVITSKIKKKETMID